MSKSRLDKAAMNFLNQNLDLKKGEVTTIVTDRRSCKIFDAICRAAELKKARLFKAHISDEREHSQPIPYLKKVFRKSKVIIGITDKSISHCPEMSKAIKKGTRAITMVGVDEKLFLKGMAADKNKIIKTNEKLYKLLKKTKRVRITTHSGTDILFKVIKKNIHVDDGDSTKKGVLNNFPYGEVFVAPINRAMGMLTIDYSRVGIKPKDKATVLISGGKIVDDDGNKKTENFVKYLEEADGDKALRVVELGFGTNYLHKDLTENIIHDEKIHGSVHVAFGGFGSKRKSTIHEDVILLKPNVWFDFILVIKEGKIIV
ncbi:MAG: aminopeptidase [Candidatus Nanoarchaeia archaeon]|nr:aminopeptidase [Candidatus Nanoarchaeia archaeon]